MDILQLLKDNSISYVTEGKNVQRGWVNVACPMCRDASSHGGFNVSAKELYYHCWKCGWHPVYKVVAKLLRIDWHDAKMLLSEYGGKTVLPERTLIKKPLILPGGPLQDYHKEYLMKRRFDPTYIEKKYEVLGTGPVGNLRFRLVMPITYERIIVSYHTRSVTTFDPIKSRACPKEQEIIHHKEIFYGLDFISDIIVIVEGIFDAWRVGDGAIATFGTSFTQAQVQLIKDFNPKRVFVLFDADEPGRKKGKELAATLSGRNIQTTQIFLSEGDPADLRESDISKLRKELKI